MRQLFFVASAIFLLLNNQIKGQAEYNLDTIQVSASRIEMPIQNTGRSVLVIDAKDIAEAPVMSIDELLRYLPGINVNSRGGFGVQADIGMRGSTFSQVLVLIDHVRLNDPLTGHFNNNFPIALAEIDRIEIVHGPAAASYGADAVGGLIHIRTKTFEDAHVKSEIPSVNLRSTFGQYGLLANGLNVNRSTEKFAYNFSIQTASADGETFRNPNFDLGTSDQEWNSNHFDLQTYSLATRIALPANWNAYVRASLDRRSFAAKYFYTRSSFDESEEDVKSLWTNFTLSKNRLKRKSLLNLSFKQTDDLFVFNPLFAANEHRTKMFGANYTESLSLGDKAKLAVGMQYQSRDIVSTDRGNHENQGFGVYGIWSQEWLDGVRTVGSLRLENDENFGTEILPQLSVSYAMERIVLRSSFARSIRSGDFTERYISSEIADLSPGRNIGNPDLEAERSSTIDFGLDYYGRRNTKFTAGAFYRNSTNLIDYLVTNADDIMNADNLQAGEDYFYANNISDAQTFGIELSASSRIPIQSTNLDLQVNFNSWRTENSGEGVSKYLANHPKYNLNANLDWNSKRLSWNAVFSAIQRNAERVEEINAAVLDQYFLVDTKAAIKLQEDQFKFFVQVRNLFDQSYQEILGAQMPGRWLMLGIEIQNKN